MEQSTAYIMRETAYIMREAAYIMREVKGKMYKCLWGGDMG